MHNQYINIFMSMSLVNHFKVGHNNSRSKGEDKNEKIRDYVGGFAPTVTMLQKKQSKSRGSEDTCCIKKCLVLMFTILKKKIWVTSHFKQLHINISFVGYCCGRKCGKEESNVPYQVRGIFLYYTFRRGP